MTITRIRGARPGQHGGIAASVALPTSRRPAASCRPRPAGAEPRSHGVVRVLHGLSLRPHVKTHKSPRIAAEQMRLGAVGLTCATPREAGSHVVTSRATCCVAYPLVGAPKLARARLACRRTST